MTPRTAGTDPGESARRRERVALLCSVMNNDSAPSFVETLRAIALSVPEGHRLPASRELVRSHRVSATTVSRALARLVVEGIVEVRVGDGAYRVAPPRPGTSIDTAWQHERFSGRVDHMVPVRGDVGASGLRSILEPTPTGGIDLATGYLHQSHRPDRALGLALGRAARRPAAWGTGPAHGLASLREWFGADFVSPVAPGDVVVTSGGQSALAVTLRALAEPGDPLLVEAPTYPGILSAARGASLRPLPFVTGPDGPDLDQVDRMLGRSTAAVVVLQPRHHNPTGATLGDRQRTDLLALAARHRAFVVEDDYARWLGHTWPSGPAPTLLDQDDSGRVVTLRSLTKALSPSLRIGAVVARGEARDRILSTHVSDHFFISRVMQEAALDFVSSAAWTTHQRALGRELAARRRIVLDALDRHLPSGIGAAAPHGGYFVWLDIAATGMADRQVQDACLSQGVRVTAGGAYFTEAIGSHLRLSYAAAESHEDLRRGVATVGSVLQSSG